MVLKRSGPCPGRHEDPESVAVAEQRRISAVEELVLDGATHGYLVVDLGPVDFEQFPAGRWDLKCEPSAAVCLVPRVDGREPCQCESETAPVCRGTEPFRKWNLKERLFVGAKYISCHEGRPVRPVTEQPRRRRTAVAKKSAQPIAARRARDPRASLPGCRLAPACSVDDKCLRQDRQGLIGDRIIAAVRLQPFESIKDI